LAESLLVLGSLGASAIVGFSDGCWHSGELLRAYVHHCSRRYDFAGHLWQGRFKSPAIECRTYLLSCGRYIERNPVEAALVAEPWQYPWSSARAYGLGHADALLAENAEYLALAPDAERRQQLWREFLSGDDPHEEEVRRGDWVIGNDGFRRRVRELLGRPAPRQRGRPPKQPVRISL
jgi:putative transposase